MKTSSLLRPKFITLLATLVVGIGLLPAAPLPIEITETRDYPAIQPPGPGPCPVLQADNITTPSPHHEVTLYFNWWPEIDESSIGDGDLAARGPNGYHQRATLVSLERLPSPFPLPLNTLLDGDPEVHPLPQPTPILVATYRFAPPAGAEGRWTHEDNGNYGVRLVRGEIRTSEGRSLPPKFLGGFRCLIRTESGRPVQPEAVRCRIGRQLLPTTDLHEELITYHAQVAMSFRTPHVQINWGEVKRFENRFVVNASATRYPINTPDPGPIPVPLAGDSLRDDEPDLHERERGPESIFPTFRHHYRFGSLAPGNYEFVFRVNGEVECTKSFLIPTDPPVDSDPPEASLAVRNITQPNHEPLRLVVTYRDRSGLDVSTIGDGDLVVFNPGFSLDTANPIPIDWDAQRARLLEIIPLSDDKTKLKAIYEIEAPSGGWTEAHNGFYPVALWDEAVCDRLGNCTERQRLGGFEVAIDTSAPPVPAEAAVHVDVTNPDRVVAKVHIEFKEHWAVIEQDIRRDGNRLYLLAKALPLPIVATFPPPPPPSQDLVYEVGPLREGDYVAAFIMNGHLYDTDSFSVHRDPPIPAELALHIDSSDPANIVAEVKIQFRTPHQVETEEVKRDGHRIFLSATASPLPLPLDNSLRPPLPEPIHLRYRIGTLPPGGYVGTFIMNGYRYAAEDFVVRDPEPPIDAKVDLRVDQSDPDNTVLVARIAFQSPHAIDSRDLHQEGHRFLLEATAVPIQTFAPIPLPQIITIRYPLGALEPGQYGAAFVMNGYLYAKATWEQQDHLIEAKVSITVDQSAVGSWRAKVSIAFADPRARITERGKVSFDGHRLRINATAIISDTTDAPPNPLVLHYELGELDPGPYSLRYFINESPEAHHEFFVERPGPIPAEVKLAIHSAHQPVIATAHIQFHDHYRIVSQATERIGNLFILEAKADGPLPLLAPIPPPPVELHYDLGTLPRGEYHTAFRMNGHTYREETFRIGDHGFEAKVKLEVTLGDSVTLQAVVDIDDPYVLITDPGTPIVTGDLIKINATAQRVTFIVEPSGDPQTIHYELGALLAGPYQVVYCINKTPEARLGFEIPADHPVANISHIKIAHGDASWFSEVGVILLPGQQVTDWGMVRRDKNVFHVNITVDWVDFPPPEIPLPTPLPFDPALPDGITYDSAGNPLVGGFPVQLVTHRYVLGVLDPGPYGFVVHSRGQLVAGERFEVPGSPPQVALSAEPLTEATDEYHFGINYHDPDGLDHESIMAAEIMVRGPNGYSETASLLAYASTDDFPSTNGLARYALHGPGGSWDFPDNGKYCLHVDPTQIRDLLGNHLHDGQLGCFPVRLLPPAEPGVHVSVAMNPAGEWEATVEILSKPGAQVVVDAWGPVIHHGSSLVALASVHTEATPEPTEPIAHTYNLGSLQPGYYVFVFKSDQAHCGFAGFTVPGLEGDPLDNWQRRAIGPLLSGGEGDDLDHDGLDVLGEFFFATDPTRADRPQFSPEIVLGEDGRTHLGLRFRRLLGAEGVTQIVEGSRNLQGAWEDVSSLTDIVTRTPDIDGTEEVLLCLRDSLAKSPYHFLRLKLIRE